MSKAMYKFVVTPDLGKMVTVSMPVDAQIHHTGIQNGDLCLWAEVDTDVVVEDRHVLVVATGETIPEMPEYHERFYVDTFNTMGLVYHVFEVYDVRNV